MKPHQLFPHGSLERIAANTWQVEGSQSMPLKRNMTVHRLSDGRLVLYSVVALDAAGMQALEALGTPWLMVIPGTHTIDARFYKARYPQLLVAHDDLAELADLKSDGTPETLLTGTGVEVIRSAGLKRNEACLLVPADNGKLLVACDILGRNSPRQPGIGGRIMAFLSPPGGVFGVARIVKFRQVKDKHVLREWVRGLAARSDLVAVLGSHGPALTSNVAPSLQDAAQRI